MKVIKTQTRLKKMSKTDDSFTNISPPKRISFMCPLTEDFGLSRNQIMLNEDYKDILQILLKNKVKFLKNKESTGRLKDKADADSLRKV